MKPHPIRLAATLGLSAILVPVALAQQTGGTGGATGGGFGVPTNTQTGGGGTVSNSLIPAQSSTNTFGGVPSSLSGTSAITRSGFLSPADKLGKGFLTPSNTTATSTTGRTAGGTNISGISTRLGGLGGFGGMGGFGGNQLGTQNANSTATQLRIPMRISGNAATSSSVGSAAAVRFVQRVGRLPGLGPTNSVSLSVSGRTAVLQGTVASREQGELLGRLALLEPGISDVRNELTVDSGLALPGSLPPAQ